LSFKWTNVDIFPIKSWELSLKSQRIKYPPKTRGDIKNAESNKLFAERNDKQYAEMLNHKKAQDNHSTMNQSTAEISKGRQRGKNYPSLIIHAQKNKALESIGL
jgi:hypothetical protein